MSFVISLIKPIVYISLPALLLRSVASSSPTGRYYVRIGVYIGTLTLVATWGVVVSAAMSIAGRRYDVNYVVARTFYAITKRVLDITVEVENEEGIGIRPAVLMSNHQSMLDIILLGRIFPKQASIMAKKELQFSPLGGFMAMSGTIFIDRGNNAKAVRSMQMAGDGMKARKSSLWMYPEGTRHNQQEPSILPLKKGGFHLAIQAGIPIVPVVSENYWRLYHKGVFESGTIKMRVLPPIPTTGLTSADVNDLVNRVRDQMLETLRDISVKVHPRLPDPGSTSSSVSESSDPPAPTSTTMTSGEARTTSTDSVPESLETIVHAESCASLEASSRKKDESENGAETEEDEGMVLVGRPF